MGDMDSRMGRLWHKYRVIVLVVLLIAIAAVAALLFLNKDREPTVVDNALQQAQSDTTKGDYGKAYDRLKDAEGQATSKQEKVALYGQLAAAAANAGKLDEAIGYLEKRHQLDASTINFDAELLGGYYERKGDTAAALKQYKLALAYYQSLPQGDIGTQVTISGLKERVAELEGAQQ